MLDVADGVNAFLRARKQDEEAGELAPSTWAGYKATAELIIACLGRKTPIAELTPEDFASLRAFLGKGRCASTLKTEIRKARVIFKWLHDSELIEHPARFGKSFKSPPKRILLLEKDARGERFFEPDQIHWLLDHANINMRAFVLLGINAAYIPADLIRLENRHINLETGWIFQPRHKTGEPRRCKLWPETVQAVRRAIARRPKPKSPEHANRVFLTQYGNAWGKSVTTNRVSENFRELLLAKAPFYRKGHAFVSLRRTFRTVADKTLDWPAVNKIMGHSDLSMGGVYRQHVADERIEAVCRHVRMWLYGGGAV